jgi:protein-tyrosine phosphatase
VLSVNGRTVDRVMTDLHCHILPGVDDGPATLEGALALARAFVAGGVGRVVATPHVSLSMPTAAEVMRDRVALLRAELARAGIPLAVEPGAEVAAARLPDLDATELAQLTLGDGRWILLEAPLTTDFPIEEAADSLLTAGYGVLLAHPERCALFQRDPRRVRDLVAAGARVSVTAAALGGGFGRPARALGRALAASGLVHNAASDAHDTAGRPPSLLAELRAAGFGDRAEAWCSDCPAEILDPGSVPVRPHHRERAPDDVARSMAREGAGSQEIVRALEDVLPPAAARRTAARALHDRGRGADT